MSRNTTDLTERDAPRTRTTTSFRLVVTTGNDRDKDVWVYPSSPGPTRIGTSAVCELVLADRKVSRRHASVECRDGRLHVTDLQSTNGTSVNGIAIESALLAGGELLRLGDTTVSVEAHQDATGPELSKRTSFGRVLGSSAAMRRLYPMFERLAEAATPVIIEGETGVGKELLAEALHEMGPRKNGPFVTVEVGGASPAELERSLFGEERDGHVEKGAFEEAQGGTLLIDDIAELPLALQTRLLRAVDRREIVRASGTQPVAVDVRLLCASKRNLDREVETGNLREDLFHRLAVGRVELPPLRKRTEDIALLADHFWREMDRSGASLPADLVLAESHTWPGNVRELKNAVIRRLTSGAPLPAEKRGASTEAAGQVIENALAQNLSFAEARARMIAEFERIFVAKTLERHGGNVTRAAAASGLARRYFHRLKARHGD